MNTTAIETAKRFLENYKGQLASSFWQRGDKVRVYLSYPRGWKGGAGGGSVGYVDFSRGKPVINYAVESELNAEIKAAF